jgi:hypothetical protein
MLTANEVSIIGNLINTTWGRSSTEPGTFPLSPGQGNAYNPASLTARLTTETVPGDDAGGHILIVNYVDIVSFRSDLEAQANVKLFRQTAEKLSTAKLAYLKSEFKAASGRALKAKLKSFIDSVEPTYSPTPAISLIAAPALRPQLFRGYYRYSAIFSVS